MSESRADVTLEELGTAIRLWIRCSPPGIWRADQIYEELRAQKKHDPSKAPDPRGDLAAFLTDKFARQDWRVTRPESVNFFEHVGEGPNFRGGYKNGGSK
jgi:hypothetical protein